MNRSRLSRKLEQQSKKNLFLSIFGIIVVLLILIKFGIPLLINFSLFLSGSRGSQEEAKNNITAFVPVPVLNPIPSATSSAEIILSGFAAPMQIIELYVNSDLVDKTQVKEDGTFSFREIISEGENIIKAKAIINDKKSDFSKSILVTMKNKSPYLNLVSPLDGQSFSKDQNIIDIQGTTDPNIKVTVNGFWAITDGNGNFSYRLSLQNGENNIKIVAIDEAGNKTEKELRVIYNP
ncbi:MAG: hypothetical protein HYT07_02980 [Candidatus Levybacteria bacterium]|nr:hypothetical protein [Candidatus Levybacteria bacterium]